MAAWRKLIDRIGARSRAERIARAPFYVRFPYRHALPLAACDARGAVDVERRLFFNRVPKCANSTVAVRLVELRLRRIVPAREAKRSFARPSDLDANEVAELDDFFKFTVVRNPYARALSAYLNKIASGRKRKYLQRAGIEAIDPSFRDFCTYLDHGGLFENAHWAPQTSLMLLPVERFDRIGKVETLSEDLRAIFARIAPGRPATSAERSGPAATHAESKLAAHYDETSAAIVARLYRSDFETFGYSTRLTDALAPGG